MQPIRPRKILVITYWAYDDGLVQAYVLPYLRILLGILPTGSAIHLITLEPSGGSTPQPMAGVVHHPFRYQPFGLHGLVAMAGLFWRSLSLVRKENIDVIHSWCTPAGLIGYLLSVLTGRPLVVDSYEPHAEAMVENGTWRRGGIAFRLLFLAERLQTRRAMAVIAASEGMRDYARTVFGHVPRHFFVKPACVDLEHFSGRNVKKPELLRALGLDGKLVAVYAGKFGGIYLAQEVFDFFRTARDHWGERFRVLLLTAHRPEELRPFMDRAGLDPSLFVLRFVPHAEIPDHMGLGDFAVTPVKPVPSKRYCSPIKDGEYWALGLPVVITPDISEDSELIARSGMGAVIVPGDTESYRQAVARLDALLTGRTRHELYEMIRPIAETHRSYALAEAVYRSVYGKGDGIGPMTGGRSLDMEG
jgi:glycosyltransferase involved in cell wall biosynthesis